VRPRSLLSFGVLSLVILSCASSDTVDLTEPKRVLGRENNVHVDAQIFADRVAPNSLVRVTYEIENKRHDPIAVADIIPEVAYEASTRTITVSMGSEVPGNELVPRLIRILPGERKNFTTGVRIDLFMPAAGALVAFPRFLNLKVNFLGETEAFQKLIDIPEKAIRDPQLADALFPKWIESNEAVVTNAIPIQWLARNPDTGVSAETGGSGRFRRRGRPPGTPF